MVRVALVCFAAGTWALQQSAELPSLWGLCIGVASLSLWAVAPRVLHRMQWPRGRTLWLMCAAFLAGYSWAAWRAQLRLAYTLPLEFERRDIKATGIIASVPLTDARRTRFIFKIEQSDPTAPFMPRLVQLSWYAQAGLTPVRLRPGERWTFTVRLVRPHGNANYHAADLEASMLERNLRATGYVREHPTPQRRLGHANSLLIMLEGWRDRQHRRINEVLGNAPHTGIVSALALGLQMGISPDDRQRFTRTGTNHLVAISGLHISLVAGFAAALASWLWRRSCWIGKDWPLWLAAPRVAAVAGAGAGFLYAGLAGFGVPAQRALLMLLIVGISFLSARRVAASAVLAWALAVVVTLDPWALTSAGCWLSFGAVAVILLAASASRVTHSESVDQVAKVKVGRQWSIASIHRRLTSQWHRMLLGFKTAAQIQVAVSLGLIPLTALWFAQVPLLSPLANAFAIPWVSFLVTPLVLIGMVVPAPLDIFALQAAHACLVVLAAVLDVIAAPSWALYSLRTPDALALAFAALGIGWSLLLPGWPLRGAAPLLFLPLAVPPSSAPAEGEFRMTVLDVGQGAAALIETAHHRLLFDTGPRYDVTSDAGQRIVMPFLRARGIKQLDALVISHADTDHAGGARTVLAELPVVRMRASLVPKHPLWRQARAQHVKDSAECRAGESWVWDGVTFTMLWPDEKSKRGTPLKASQKNRGRELRNQVSCVLHVSNTHHAALLPGDIEAREERALLAQQPAALSATILLAPHHGSRTSSSADFLAAVAPRDAVFQVGYRNRFKHPNAGVVARYQAYGITLHRSDQDGAVQFQSAGTEIFVERYRTARRRYWMGH
ncbi:DNA internalization-related competence protein ComEC/Rec2 [Mycoavidus sp. B2-EB]|uniref:DNA internalization-related competence protein ComEC/Rec2 n=1 Tax=Mycoavidus sp. B2-EB TaxID=2651972 RepID=UPI00162398D6|nr:DNA internalization-related competence protein ComEC/Rec2 [Mycoavidus sp. B2-EB]BBO59980.1 DNA internalization-related competence protein ComEC/Rec2 [Mycoavidus sp. B2-EB]